MSDPEVLYSTHAQVAYITLNRPAHLNAITATLPSALRTAVQQANLDDSVHCIVLKGAGKGFCGGYDLSLSAEKAVRGNTVGSQDLKYGYDPLVDYQAMRAYTNDFMSLFHSNKPTIAQIHGAAVAGGSDIALCCDLVVMAEDARIGYPPARVWGCPTTAMWTARIGPEKAKRIMFTGDLISGREAADMGLVLKAVPVAQLEESVRLLTERIKTVPKNQLWMCKQVVNGFVEDQLNHAQRLATVFDGITRNSPEGVEFQTLSAEKGFKAAIKARDEPGRSVEYRKTWKSVL